jgi:hypothetical protein
MVSYRGVVKGNVVVLDETADLADGSLVEVRPVGLGGDAADDQRREALFKEYLVERGLLDRVRQPGQPAEEIDRTPIPILAGPLVSETIIEERR